MFSFSSRDKMREPKRWPLGSRILQMHSAYERVPMVYTCSSNRSARNARNSFTPGRSFT